MVIPGSRGGHIVAEDWRIDGIDRRLDRIEREMRNGDERGERRVGYVEGRVNGSIYQMLLERMVLQLAALAVIALIVGVAASRH
jgi:hypothetical protein